MNKTAEYFFQFEDKRLKLGEYLLEEGMDDDDMFPHFIEKNPLIVFQSIDSELRSVKLPDGLSDFLKTLRENNFDPMRFDGIEEMIPELLHDLVEEGFTFLSKLDGQWSVLVREDQSEDGHLEGRSATLEFLEFDY